MNILYDDLDNQLTKWVEDNTTLLDELNHLQKERDEIVCDFHLRFVKVLHIHHALYRPHYIDQRKVALYRPKESW